MRRRRRWGGGQIREPYPVRAQSAGGNASGKPPYPCSDLEDAQPLRSADTVGREAALHTNQLQAATPQQWKTMEQ